MKQISDATKSKHASKAAAAFGWTGGAFLSAPAKMPGFSWSLPAGKTCPAGKASVKAYGDDAICSHCYACKGRYIWPTVANALQARMDFLTASLREDGGSRWIDAMVAAIQATRKAGADEWFRIHDAGDMFSVAYINAWAQVADRCPETRFWIPTREWATKSLAKIAALRALGARDNVRVRGSALRLDEPAPEGGSAVHTTPEQAREDGCLPCPATMPKMPSTCAENGCTACWTFDGPISYIAH